MYTRIHLIKHEQFACARWFLQLLMRFHCLVERISWHAITFCSVSFSTIAHKKSHTPPLNYHVHYMTTRTHLHNQNGFDVCVLFTHETISARAYFDARCAARSSAEDFRMFNFLLNNLQCYVPRSAQSMTGYQISTRAQTVRPLV